MANKLFVGGFPYETSRDELVKLFSAHGNVTDAKVIMDRETGNSKGFGFVEMSTEAEAKTAAQKLNSSIYGGRTIFVTEAGPQEKGAGGFAGKPGFVERRVGPRDRRRQPGGGFGGEKKSWDRKAGGFGDDRKPWGGKPGGGFKKKWDDKPGFGGPKKSWGDKPGGGFKKKWDDKPGFGGPKKSWGDKPGGGFKKKWGGKPGGKPGGGFRGKPRPG